MNFHSIRCPGCKRDVITRRDLLYGPIDGTTRCRACGKISMLDLFSRWTISCLIALILPSVLLYGNVFYSGHLFLVSLFFIFAAWRVLLVIGFPLLTLEPARDRRPITLHQSMILAVALLAVALTVDSFMAARFDPPDGYADAAVEKKP